MEAEAAVLNCTEIRSQLAMWDAGAWPVIAVDLCCCTETGVTR